MRLSRAVTHIRLCDANHAKIAALDALAAEYLMSPPIGVTNEPWLINVRKLAALDLVLHGPWFILAEFGFAVALGAALGVYLTYDGLFSSQGHSPVALIMGIYTLLLGINYVPLLLHAIDLVRHRAAADELAYELTRKDYYVRKYSIQQFLVLVPLALPILALQQGAQRRTRA